MTRRDLAAVTMRSMAILSLLLGLHAASNQLYTAMLDGNGQYGWQAAVLRQGLMTFMPCLALACLAVALWFFADVMAYFVAGKSSPNEAPTAFTISAPDALIVLISVVGVYLVSGGLITLAHMVNVWLFGIGYDFEHSSDPDFRFYASSFIDLLIDAGVGLILILRARPIAESLPAMRQMLVQSPLITAKNLGRDEEHVLGEDGEPRLLPHSHAVAADEPRSSGVL